MKRLRIPLAAAALAAVWLLPPAALAGKPRPSFFGMAQFGSLTTGDLDAMRGSKVRYLRHQLTWRAIEPDKPDNTPVIGKGHVYDWSKTDELMERIVSSKLRAQFVLYGTPSWINEKMEEPPLETKADRDNWQAFVAAAVDRYGAGGRFFAEHPGLKYRPVRDWQVWNEQNSSVRYLPEVDPAGYARLLQLAHDAIKATDPEARVILGGMFGTPGTPNSMESWEYLDRLYQRDTFRDSFDLMAVHPYSPDLYGVRYQIRRIRKVMDRHGDGNRKLQITEIGWSSAKKRKWGHLFAGRRGQARLLRGAFKILVRHRKRWGIRRVIWFTWRDPGHQVANCTFCAKSGLLRNDSTPKKSYRSFLKITGAG